MAHKTVRSESRCMEEPVISPPTCDPISQWRWPYRGAYP